LDIKYYIVEGSVLPDVFKRVVEVKKLLESDERLPVNSACQKVGISRSTYYKYKDSVYEFYENRKAKIVTFSFHVQHEPGILSHILEIIADSKANILTINQNIPMNGIALIVISVETLNMNKSVEDMINEIRDLEEVKKIDILSRT